MKRIRLFLAAATVALLTSGCNVFEPFYEEGSSNDPEVLLQDARYALESGDAEKAVALLEKAYEKDSQNPEIRVELSSALFQAGNIDLILMKDLAGFISEAPATFTGKSTSPLACTFIGDPANRSIIQFSEEAAYLTLLDQREVLDRAVALLDDLITSTLDPTTRGNAHLVQAIGLMARTVLDVQARADELGAALYRLGDAGVGYCAPDELALQALQSYILCDKVPDLDEAIDLLALRQTLLGSNDSELHDLLQDAREDIAAGITASCGIERNVAG